MPFCMDINSLLFCVPLPCIRVMSAVNQELTTNLFARLQAELWASVKVVANQSDSNFSTVIGALSKPLN